MSRFVHPSLSSKYRASTNTKNDNGHGYHPHRVQPVHRSRVSVRICTRNLRDIRRLHLLPFMSDISHLPNDVLACISSHLADPGGMSCASRACYTGTRTEISRRVIQSCIYYKALRTTCLSRRELMCHAFDRRRDGFGYTPPYTCSMCQLRTRYLGGCAHCRTMTQTHPWMRLWYRALPVYVIRMFHEY